MESRRGELKRMRRPLSRENTCTSNYLTHLRERRLYGTLHGRLYIIHLIQGTWASLGIDSSSRAWNSKGRSCLLFCCPYHGGHHACSLDSREGTTAQICRQEPGSTVTEARCPHTAWLDTAQISEVSGSEKDNMDGTGKESLTGISRKG